MFHLTLCFSMQYLECMADLPWQVCTEEHVDISRARHQLDEGMHVYVFKRCMSMHSNTRRASPSQPDHYGLDKVKERILQYLAVRKLSKDSRGPIICLVGPPGVVYCAAVDNRAQGSYFYLNICINFLQTPGQDEPGKEHCRITGSQVPSNCARRCTRRRRD